jgi:hypothetical protein
MLDVQRNLLGSIGNANKSKRNWGKSRHKSISFLVKFSYSYPFGLLFIFLLKKSSLVRCVLMH